MPVGSGRYFQPLATNPNTAASPCFLLHTPAPDRRRFLIASSLATAVAPLPAWVRATESLAHNPFTLGVASGDPEPDNILIWTRLTAPLDYLGTAVAPDLAAQTVHWEVAHDAQFRQAVAHGQTQARAEWGHAVHVQVNGLSPTAGISTASAVATPSAPRHAAVPPRRPEPMCASCAWP
jgi:alkaline phosphatase D